MHARPDKFVGFSECAMSARYPAATAIQMTSSGEHLRWGTG
jgi:hypothetical protein